MQLFSVRKLNANALSITKDQASYPCNKKQGGCHRGVLMGGFDRLSWRRFSIRWTLWTNRISTLFSNERRATSNKNLNSASKVSHRNVSNSIKPKLSPLRTYSSNPLWPGDRSGNQRGLNQAAMPRVFTRSKNRNRAQISTWLITIRWPYRK